MPLYALTIFTGAFLLFQVQPVIGKYILPWFGGGPGVWTTCMLFFQALLLGGYAYAHVTSRYLKPRTQAIGHLVLLAGALALLPITPTDSWKPGPANNPVLQILLLLGVSLGLPYFVLSSTGPLVQQWFSGTHPGRSPYRLYALSNVGSLLALLSYPFFFETHFTRHTQALMWGWGLGLYVICCAVCVVRWWRISVANAKTSTPAAAGAESCGARPVFLQKLLWLLLPACASLLLLAITSKLCQDVAVFPFLWVLPLAIYLLSFIICFDNPRWYVRAFTIGLVAALWALCWALFEGSDWPLWKQVAVYGGALFVCCMVCHGELYRLRPAPRWLTGFYLMIAAGGALGGLFAAVVAPLIFNNYYELHWGLLLCAALFLLVALSERALEKRGVLTPNPQYWKWLGCVLPFIAFGAIDWWLRRLGAQRVIPAQWVLALRVCTWACLLVLVVSFVARGQLKVFQHWRLLSCGWLMLGLVALAFALKTQAASDSSDTVYRSRNFYGVLTVFDYRKDDPLGHHFLLQHGRITHGLQFVDPDEARWPTTYYSEGSGIALAMNALHGARRIGVVGLGTGSLTVYGKKADYLRIYEINPEVEHVARTYFTYLKDSPAKIDVALGDARLCLEREPPQNFDVLALDAFSGDAIPVHLLTREAFQLYERHLKTNGVIAVHISNHYLDLEPVVNELARSLQYKVALVDFDENDEEWWNYSSSWMLLTRDPELLECTAIRSAKTQPDKDAKRVPLWTDDFASLFQILK